MSGRHRERRTERLTLGSIERMDNSLNGNPRWQLGFEGESGVVPTAADHAVGYEIGNPGYRVGDTVDVTFNSLGYVETMEAIA